LGDIVVDKINKPQRIIGVCQGNGLEEIFTADSEYLNLELEKIKSYYMNTNPNKYFSSIKDIISNALIGK
jgi:hypothetical protein